MAATSRVSTNAIPSMTGSNCVFNKPSGATVGDILVLHLYLGSYSPDPDPNTWTIDTTVTHNSSSPFRWTLWRVVADNDPAEYTIPLDGPSGGFGLVTLYRSDTDIPLYGASSKNVQGGTTSIVGTAITVAQTNACLEYAINYWATAGRTFTPPTGMTEVVDTGASASIYLAFKESMSTGSTGDKTATASGNVGSITGAVTTMISIEPTGGTVVPYPSGMDTLFNSHNF